MADNSTLPATGEVIATEEPSFINGAPASGVKVQRVKLVAGDPGEFSDVCYNSPLWVSFPGVPSVKDWDANDLLTAINGLNDTMVTLLSAMLEKMPRVTANDQTAVSIEAGSVGIAASQTLATVTTVGTVNNLSTAMAVPILQHNLNMPTYIYDKVVVS